jgi:hypothetical protein
MYSTQASGKQTGQVSRILHPRTYLTREAIDARIHAGTNPSAPIRNELRGASVPGLLARFYAWLRGE